MKVDANGPGTSLALRISHANDNKAVDGAAAPAQVDKQSATLWFGDGNIVLSAPSDLAANTTINFCVHSGVLRSRCQVFADMLAMPSGSQTAEMNSEEVYNGKPRVRMQDSAEDLEAFLKVLYDPWVLSSKKRITALLSRTRGFLSLADKYNLYGMKGFIQNSLEIDWPKSLEHWDIMD
ncbi:hypothetical protein SCHPADRAFT_827811, partial [Schizopora paradoxa]